MIPLFFGPVIVTNPPQPPPIVRSMSEAERTPIFERAEVHSEREVRFLVPGCANERDKFSLSSGCGHNSSIVPIFEEDAPSSSSFLPDASVQGPGDIIPDGHWERLDAHIANRQPSPPEADIEDPDPLF